MTGMRLIFCMLIVSLASCNPGSHESEGPAGGACRFRVETKPMQVLAVVKTGSGGYDLALSFPKAYADSVHTDTIWFHQTNHRLLEESELKKWGTRSGGSCLMVNEIPEWGSCDQRDSVTLDTLFKP